MKLRSMTVAQLTAYIGRLIGDDPIMNACRVYGELSAFKQYPSGHVYFTLVDGAAKLPCVMFKRAAQQQAALNFRVGDQVELSGQVRVYEREGRYQMICQTIAKQGDGVLHQRFMALKQQLAARGYFDMARKRPIERVRRIGLITSRVGAAIEDFTSILGRRNGLIEIDVYDSLVQGSAAAAQISAGIAYFNKAQSVDVIVITRGGGSMEDLWCFNDADLAAAIVNSKLPVVSAVGHEIDFTIADFAADLRAATPSAAAELLSEPLDNVAVALRTTLQKMGNQLMYRIEKMHLVLQGNNPIQLKQLLEKRITEQLSDAHQQFDAIDVTIRRQLDKRRQVVAELRQALELQSPQRIMARGYSYITDSDNKVVNSAKNIAAGDVLNVVLVDGALTTTVKGVKHDKNR